MDGLVIEAPAFAPNHLSAEAPRAESIPEAEAANVRAVLSDGWSIDGSDVRRFATGGTTAANYLIDGRLTLKIRGDAAALTREVALLRRAGAAGVPVPALRLTRNGKDVHCAQTGAAAAFEFVPGNHFRGLPAELDQAAAAFVAVARCFDGDRGLPILECNGVSERIWTALGRTPPRADPTAEQALSANADMLENAMRSDARATLDAPCGVHTDLHPLNLLLRQGRVVAVLDFEDVAVAPRAVGSGFALLKLGREALSRMAPAARREGARDLVARWRAADPVSAPFVAAGARRRVLANIATILDAWRLRGDISMNHGLAGQIESLAEADFLFDRAD